MGAASHPYCGRFKELVAVAAANAGISMGCHSAGGMGETEPPQQPLPAAMAQAEGLPLNASVPLQSGQVLRLTDLRGHVVVLALCRPSDLHGGNRVPYGQLAREFPGKIEVVPVLINADGWPADVYGAHLGWDPQGALATRLGAHTLPWAVLLDADGRVVARFEGDDSNGREQLMSQARRLLALDIPQ